MRLTFLRSEKGMATSIIEIMIAMTISAILGAVAIYTYGFYLARNKVMEVEDVINIICMSKAASYLDGHAEKSADNHAEIKNLYEV